MSADSVDGAWCAYCTSSQRAAHARAEVGRFRMARGDAQAIAESEREALRLTDRERDALSRYSNLNGEVKI